MTNNAKNIITVLQDKNARKEFNMQLMTLPQDSIV